MWRSIGTFLYNYFDGVKTLKREVIVVLLGFNLFIAYHLFVNVQPEHVRMYYELFSTLWWGSVGFMAALFGIQIGDAIVAKGQSRQTRIRTSRGTEVEETTRIGNQADEDESAGAADDRDRRSRRDRHEPVG